MTDEIHIPAWCYRTKPYFKSRPDQALIEQIIDFIKKTGQPHMWPGHTHSKPKKGGRIEYLDEYDLPKSHHKTKDRWAPCPCCSPTHPKYYKGGKIGWFPDEDVIRNMGPDCFAAFDKEGHLRAVAKLRKEQQRAKATNFLLMNLPKVPAAVRTFERAFPTIQAVDAIRKFLRKDLPLILKADLWEHIQNGTLKIKKQSTETTYASIDGHKMLDPNQPQLSPSLKSAIEALRTIEPGHDHKATIAAMSEEECEKTARMLGRWLSRAKEIFNEVDDIRQFVSVTTIATLRNWGKQEGCPMRIYAMLDGLNLYFGRKEHENRRIEIPPEFFNVLGSIPNIGEIDLAA